MEALRIDKDESVQKAVADGSSEISQLKATITTLREELEGNKLKHDEEKQKLERAARDEVKQLRETIQALRDQLES